MCKRVLLWVLLLVAAWTTPSFAQDPYARGGYGPGVQPLERVLPTVRQGRAGRFYDAEGPFPDASGGYHYRIKWLTPDGRVIWLDTDARTGRVLGVARGDWREQGPPAFGGPLAPPRGGPFAGPRGGGFGPGPGGYGGHPGPAPRGGGPWHGGHGHRGG